MPKVIELAALEIITDVFVLNRC